MENLENGGAAAGRLPLLPLVNGEPGTGAGARIADINPSTGEVFAWIACADRAEIDQAVEAATFASKLWRGAPYEERARRLGRLAQRLHEEAESIASLIALEQGKPYAEALALEVLPALDHIQFLSRHARELTLGEPIEPRHPLWSHKRALYLYDPIGVVVLVTSSSLPFAQPLIQTASALAMGNAVILKPSELTPLTALRVGELCGEAGFPAGLVNVVPASPEDTLHLVAHDQVDKVFVTGAHETGQSIMSAAAAAPRPVVLSLGGKHPSIVAGDADVDRAARGIVWGAFANAGQNCGAVERVYVEERIATRFVDALLSAVDAVRTGDPLAQDSDLGPLISEARRQTVHEHVGEAVLFGARLLRGGQPAEGPGYFYPPTVVLDPPDGCRLLQEETLGPVIPVVTVESVERAIQRANDSAFALTASGWTRSEGTAERMMVGLQAGVVTINDVLYAYGEPAATWSGFKRSGQGASHGLAGLKEMSRRRFVSFDAQPLGAPVFAYPYGSAAGKLVASVVDTLHAPARWTRGLALFRLIRSSRFRSRVPWRSFLVARKVMSR
ncbi:MAG TPA: aldehyde dehydrogenase family protein [Candidatus Polarisedimenticolaceae bacterium]|nr:aldehyde dehydrogenase family protein [Candidatus Polarisedimenticolaceae bacterium]